jgi:hypothetical protein
VRLAASLIALTWLVAPIDAQTPKLDDVVARIVRYVASYGERMASVVAEETYRQRIPIGVFPPNNERTLRSDYVLTRASGSWVGYRDTFEVDGRPVRDHDQRLQQLIANGAIAQAARIADQNSRFNLANDALPRNVNVPTFALDMLSEQYRDRFTARRAGTDVVDGQAAWVIEFQERDRPTIVRNPNGRDQPTRLRVLANPETGEILQTTVTWEQAHGSIIVRYGQVPAIDVRVPLTMSDRFTMPSSIEVIGDATYTNYRTFQTAARLINP